MKKHSKFSLVAISALIAGATIANMQASALQIRIDDNPQNLTSIKVKRRITGVDEAVTNSFTYKVTGQATNLPANFQINFEDAIPTGGAVEAEYDLDISAVSFSDDPGMNTLTISEISSSDAVLYPVSTDQYTLEILVENATDANNVPTGEKIITTAEKVAAKNGIKSDDAVFQGERQAEVLTHLTLDVEVKGKAANKDDVFKYAVIIYGEDEEEYNVVAPSGKYKFGGKEFENPTVVKANTIFYIYLKADELALIGQNAAGEDELHIGQKYAAEQYDENHYSNYIDDEGEGLRTKIAKTLEEDPKSNHTHFINKKNPIDDFVDTGVIVRAAPFVVLAAVAIVAIACSVKFRNKKA